jgi:hypothetical protein
MKKLKTVCIILALAALLSLPLHIPRASAQIVECIDTCLQSLSNCSGSGCDQTYMKCVEDCLDAQ